MYLKAKNENEKNGKTIQKFKKLAKLIAKLRLLDIICKSTDTFFSRLKTLTQKETNKSIIKRNQLTTNRIQSNQKAN